MRRLHLNELAHLRLALALAGLLALSAACSSGSTPTTGAAAGGTKGESGSAMTAGASGQGLAGAFMSTGGAGAGGGSSGGGPSAGAAGGSGASSTGGAGGSAGAGGSSHASYPFPKLIQDCDVPTAHAHANTALGVTLANFWSGADQYLRATSPASNKLAGYWTYAQGFDAVLDGVERTGGHRFSGLIRAFYEGASARGWMDDSFDHEIWLTLALLRAYDLTADMRYLTNAEALYQNVMAAWDTTCCAPHPGGIWSDKKKTQKSSTANAGSALAGVRLAERTNKPEYLTFAKQVYSFWMSNMVDATTFAVAEYLTPDGQPHAASFTYIQGLMIGAALALNDATGEAHYLTEAKGFAHYMSTQETHDTSVGAVLFDGTSCAGDCAAWKGIGYRYLAELYRRDPTNTEARNVLTSSASAIWSLARNGNNGFFSANWAGPGPTNGALEEQSSATMALNLFATLCGTDLAAPAAAAGVYEAEEGWLEHVDFEATAGRAFLGLGYVSAFTSDKQGVVIDVQVPSAGQYALVWRYTAGEGSGVRSVRVNGQALAQTQAFPATPSWTAWQNAQTNATLPAGKVSIELYFDAAKGSKTSLDIDQLTVSPQ
ncbi:MAG: glycoside hydrolase family 76 protein [Pseudomonadota bacterium]